MVLVVDNYNIRDENRGPGSVGYGYLRDHGHGNRDRKCNTVSRQTTLHETAQILERWTHRPETNMINRTSRKKTETRSTVLDEQTYRYKYAYYQRLWVACQGHDWGMETFLSHLHNSLLFLCILNFQYLWNLEKCSDQAQIVRKWFLYFLLLFLKKRPVVNSDEIIFVQKPHFDQKCKISIIMCYDNIFVIRSYQSRSVYSGAISLWKSGQLPW